jgi:intraflagellar transport protein 88
LCNYRCSSIDNGQGYGNSTYGKAPATAFRAPATASKQQPLGTALGQPNRGASRGGVPGSRMGLTTAGGGGGGEARPMTSVSGAGYQSSKEHKSFDPLNIGRGPAPPLAEKSDNGPEYTAKDMEKKVHRLLEASAFAAAEKDYLKCLEKAKEAGKAERALCKYKESHGLAEQINIDLTYSIFFNLANAHHLNKMYEEALNTYKIIVKNKQYPQSGRLRINMGNIYYDQKLYQQAIKMYRMALDQIPATGRELRFRVCRNIGNAFVKLGQFQDAIENYETVMNGSPDIQTGFNLLLCLYARGDKEKIKKHFTKMLSIPISGMTEHDEELLKEILGNGGVSSDFDIDQGERFDALKIELQRRYEQNSNNILTVARLIAPLVADEKEEWITGYKWAMEQLRPDFEIVSSKLEIDLSMAYMRKKQFDEAIEILKAFEKKDMSLRAMAGTNLSFIYFLEGDLNQAEKHADVAMKADRYNAKALVNKGNCHYMAGEYGRAKEMYLEAIGVEADCVEAIFNLGLVNIKINAPNNEANQAFEKLHTILPNAPEALYQLGAIYEKGGSVTELEQAAKTYELLLHKVPGDPNVCNRLGQVYEKLDDENTACHWMTEAHRHFPVNLNVISWLGVWYVKREMYEQAIEFFEQASSVQPGEVKWRLMVTSCYRRLGDYFKALELYQQVIDGILSHNISYRSSIINVFIM